MAVPSSGSISLAGLAAEKDKDDYTDVDYDDTISLKDVTLGGDANGSHISFDVPTVLVLNIQTVKLAMVCQSFMAMITMRQRLLVTWLINLEIKVLLIIL